MANTPHGLRWPCRNMLLGATDILSYRIVHFGVSEKYGNHNVNQSFSGCLVPDYDLSVINEKGVEGRASSFMLMFTDYLAETTHFRPAK